MTKHTLEVSSLEARKESLPRHVSKLSMSISPVARKAGVGRGAGTAVRAPPPMPSNIGNLALPTFGVATPTRVVDIPSAASGPSSVSSMVTPSQKETPSADTRASFLALSSGDDE